MVISDKNDVFDVLHKIGKIFKLFLVDLFALCYPFIPSRNTGNINFKRNYVVVTDSINSEVHG